MYDIVALGEILIDFAPEGMNDNNVQLFSCNPGGAPANVLAMAAKLGGKTAFIGKVGKDSFGQLLIDTLSKNGIDYSGVVQDPRYHTTLGFVQLDHKGDRSFSFYRDPGADLMLTNEEVPNRLLQQCSIFHFGSLSMTDEPCRSATLEAAQTARSKGAIITYDPNYRDPLWESEAKAKEYILNAMPLANILKVSEEEMLLLTGKTDLEIGAEELSKLGPSIIFVTLGSKGSFCYTKKFSLLVPAYKVCTVDTTGAGDAFFGALLWQLKGKTLEEICEMQRKDWEETLSFANAAGGLTTQLKGAMPAMPDFDAIMTCVHSGNIF